MKIAILGSIDSGKSTLCGRIVNEYKKLNIKNNFHLITDTFQEEKNNNKTIRSSVYCINNHIIVNTPGHLEYITDIINNIANSQYCILIYRTDSNYKNNEFKFIYDICSFFKKQVFVLKNTSSKKHKENEINLLSDDISIIFSKIFSPNSYSVANNTFIKANSIVLYDDIINFGLTQDYKKISIKNYCRCNNIFYDIQFDERLNSNSLIGLYNKNNKLIGCSII